MEEVPKDSPTVTKSAFRLILLIAVSNYWTLVTTDIKSAFLQGNKLERKIMLNRPKKPMYLQVTCGYYYVGDMV